MTATRALVDIAASQVGVKEEGGNNRGDAIEQYQLATWLQAGPWPWCAAFVAWCIREWLKRSDVRIALKLPTDDACEKWRPREVAAFRFEKWARHRGIMLLPESTLAKAGDLVVFDFSHIGIVERDQSRGETHISTIEGNTNGRGQRDSESGDGVFRKLRYFTLVKSYIRLA